MNEQELKLKIMADISDLKDKMGEATKGVEDFKGKTKSMASRVGDNFKKVVKATAAVTGAVAAGGVAMWKMGKDAAATGDRIHKLSQKMGFSTKGFQEWDYILSQNGASMETVQAGMRTLTRKTDDLRNSVPGATEAFGKLGISWEDLEGKSPEEVFEKTVKGLMDIEDESERAALAQELLGRSGAELGPLLNSGAASMEELREQAHQLGIVLDEEAIQASADFTDKMDDLERSFEAVKTKIGVALMPILTAFIDYILDHMPQIKAVMEIVFDTISTLVEIAIGVFQGFIDFIKEFVDLFKSHLSSMDKSTGGTFDAIKAAFKSVLKPVFEAIGRVVNIAKDIFKAAMPFIMTVVEVAFEFIKTIWNSILKPTFDFIIDIVNAVLDIFEENMPLIESVFEAMGSAIKAIWEAVIQPAIKAVGAIIEWLYDIFITFILPLVKLVAGWFGDIAGFMMDNITKASTWVSNKVEAIKGFFSSLSEMPGKVKGFFTDIYTGIRDKINSARDAVKNAIEKIKGFFKFSWSLPKLKMPHISISGSFSIAPPRVPKFGIKWYSRGGIFTKPTILPDGRGVGDASNGRGSAPEVVAPLSDLRQMLGLDKRNDESATINLYGNYGFRDKDDMDYFLNELALTTRRA